MLIPFVDRVVPVIADDVVQREFGTGAVKITPAHDHDDFATGQRHGLPIIDVMTDDGRINEHGAAYAGLTREEARERIVADLEARGDLEKAEPHEMVIGRCQRSDDIVEPRLKTQWFVKTQADGRQGDGRRARGPDGVRPAALHARCSSTGWRTSTTGTSAASCGGATASRRGTAPTATSRCPTRPMGPTACAVCGRPAAELRQDEDIFDTWFSSGLWPFSTLGWPEDTPDLRRYYPTTVMETGYDIIFFWVARMMMLGEWLTGEEPFRTVYLHGMVRDPYGGKMSKTKGNVVDPLAVIDEIGRRRAALRAHPRLGRRAPISVSAPRRLEGARNFANKLWNAARFVIGARPAGVAADAPLGLPDAALARTGRALDPGRAARHDRRRSSGRTPSSSSARRRGCSTTRSGATTATGTSSWPRSTLSAESESPTAKAGHLADACLGARPLPAPAPPGHAPRDRGDLGDAAATGRRSRAADRRPVARAASDAAADPRHGRGRRAG